MFTDCVSLDDLHAMAIHIGMRLEWFQSNWRAPHYDLTSTRRIAALSMGVVEVDRRTAVAIWRRRRELVLERHPDRAIDLTSCGLRVP